MDERASAFARLCDSIREGAYVGTVRRLPSIDAATETAWGETRTLAANPHLRAILGTPADTPDEAVTAFDHPRFVDPTGRILLFDRLAAEGSVTDQLLRLRRDDGTPIWVEVTAHAESGPGADLRVSALIRNVSDRKQREDHSRDLHHQLLQTEKMAALGQTISGVAHELNNPLATILSWAERLTEQPADEKTRRGLDVILAEAERAARIVRHLLTLARKRQTTRMMVDVSQIIRDTIALRTDEPGAASLQFDLDLAEDLPEVFVDGHQVQQVLLNLVINAEQAMLGSSGRGTITVRTRHDTARESVVIEVEDDGPGIPGEVQGRVFDPFFTTKEVGKGTGLGLSVAYAIVHEHGGRIWLDSAAGRGTTFFVELPVSGQAVQQKKPASPPVLADSFKGLRALVVEDEPALATAVSEALSDAGFTVERASDGEEGLMCLARGTFDLIVCDLKMPRIDGMQFYRAMAAATPALARRVIFVTGAVAGTDAERFLEETGCPWLAKPFRLRDLLRAAREAIA